MIKVEHYHNAIWNDITDYIENLDKIPVSPRNRDFTPQAPILNIEVAITIKDFYGNIDFRFASDDAIKISLNNALIFSGYVDIASVDYDTDLFQLSIKNELLKLRDYVVDYPTLHASLALGDPVFLFDGYVAADYFGGPDVYIPYLIKKIFAIAGFTIDVIDFNNAIAFSWNFGLGDTDILYARLYLDENMLYCINQSIAVFHSTLDMNNSGASDYKSGMITFYDFFCELCSMLSISLRLTGVGNYKLIFETTNFLIDPDDEFSYKLTPLKGENSSAKIYASFVNDRSKYRDATPTSIVNDMVTGCGEPPGNLPYKSNLVIYADNRITATGIYTPMQLYPTATVNHINAYDVGMPGYGGINTGKNKYKANVSNSEKELVLTNATLTEKTVLENNIEPEWENSEIVQESF